MGFELRSLRSFKQDCLCSSSGSVIAIAVAGSEGLTSIYFRVYSLLLFSDSCFEVIIIGFVGSSTLFTF